MTRRSPSSKIPECQCLAESADHSQSISPLMIRQKTFRLAVVCVVFPIVASAAETAVQVRRNFGEASIGVTEHFDPANMVAGDKG